MAAFQLSQCSRHEMGGDVEYSKRPSCSRSVRSDSRPHVTPLIAVRLDDAILQFCTGATGQKAVNPSRNSHVILTTGCNYRDTVVVEGVALQLPCKFLPYRSDGGQCNVCANCTDPGDGSSGSHT